MVEGKGIGIGIGIGIVMGILIGIIASPLVGISMSNQSNPIADIIQIDDPKFARLQADYDETDNRLSVYLYFTDSDGRDVKADGKATITVTELDWDSEKTGRPYSYEFEFEKDGFQTWRDSSGVRHIAHVFKINQEFAGGIMWDASIDIETKSGLFWDDVDTTFYSSD